MFLKKSESPPSSSVSFASVAFVFFIVSTITCTVNGGSFKKHLPCALVVGGRNAAEGRFPYMCSIRKTDDLEHACGGTLIKGRWLLTAAHCFDPTFSVSTGVGSLVYCDIHRKNEYNRSKVGVALIQRYADLVWCHGKTYSIDIIHTHGKWESKLEKGYDIALIKLNRVADLPVPMLAPQSDTYPIGGGYSVLGWGTTNPKKCTDKLQIGIDLQAESIYNCTSEDVWGQNITNCMICAGGGSLDTAKGDSGGPFLQLDKPLGYLKDGDPALDRVVGITSFGVGEESRKKIEKPGVYTSVGFFSEWIDCIVEEKMIKRKCDVIPVKPGPSVVPSPSSPKPPPPSPVTCPPVKRSEKDSSVEEALERMKKAIEKDDSLVVKCILDERRLDANTMYLVIVDRFPNYTTSLLHLAALHNATESSEVLVDHGADADIRDDQERTPLHVAVEQNSLGVAKVLVRKGANLDATANRGDSPLHFAAFYGHESIVEFLIKEGADVNSKNVNGETPLYIAAAKGFVSIVEILLADNASKSEVENSGDTPYDSICQDLNQDTKCDDKTRARLKDLLSND